MNGIADAQSFLAPLIGLGLGGAAFCGLADKLVPVVPSYVLLLASGMLMVNDLSDLAPIVMATTLGSVLGSLLWYLVGRGLGETRGDAFVDRFGGYLFLAGRRYSALKLACRKNTFWVALIAQTIPAVRVYVALPAGVLRLPPFVFTLATILGALLWNAPLLALGFLLRGTELDPITAGVTAICIILLIEIATVAILRPHLRPTAARFSSCVRKLARSSRPSHASRGRAPVLPEAGH